jgi:DNA-directed RNA polymerase subunit RPC12/RpoP
MAFRFRCQSCDAVHEAEEISRQKTMKCPTCGFASLEMEIVRKSAKQEEPPVPPSEATTPSMGSKPAPADDPDATIAPSGRQQAAEPAGGEARWC